MSDDVDVESTESVGPSEADDRVRLTLEFSQRHYIYPFVFCLELGARSLGSRW